MVAAVDDHLQRLGGHQHQRFRARLTHRFRLGGDVNHMGFARGVNMCQLHGLQLL